LTPSPLLDLVLSLPVEANDSSSSVDPSKTTQSVYLPEMLEVRAEQREEKEDRERTFE